MEEDKADIREEGEESIREAVRQMLKDGADRVEIEIMLGEIARDIRHLKL